MQLFEEVWRVWSTDSVDSRKPLNQVPQIHLDCRWRDNRGASYNRGLHCCVRRIVDVCLCWRIIILKNVISIGQE